MNVGADSIEVGIVGSADSVELIEFITVGPSYSGWCESRHTQQIVGAGSQIGLQLRASDADDPTLSQPADGLGSTEDLLDMLSLALADAVAVVARGPRIQTRRDAPVDARDVGPDPVRAQVRDKALAGVALVGTEGVGVDALSAQAAERLRECQDFCMKSHTLPMRENIALCGSTSPRILDTPDFDPRLSLIAGARKDWVLYDPVRPQYASRRIFTSATDSPCSEGQTG